MQQHPLPQNVTTYQFHLIGSMTLKQFLYLAAALGVAWFIYSLPLFLPLKWVLMGTSILTGIAFSFLPYQDRPLDHWFITFVKSIYTPTQFTWKKHPHPPELLSHALKPKAPPKVETTPTDTKSLETYLRTLPQTDTPSALDTRESQSLTAIMQLFQSLPSPPLSPQILYPVAELYGAQKSVKIRVRKLTTPPPRFQPEQASVVPIIPSPPLPRTGANHYTLTTTPSSSSSRPSVSATTNIKLPFPQTPTIPNVIVGMTLDSHRNILDNAIVEIKDTKNHPVRALKSNKLGQFYIATPLPDGTYEISVEKLGYSFDIVKLTLKGDIIPPLELRAKSS